MQREALLEVEKGELFLIDFAKVRTPLIIS